MQTKEKPLHFQVELYKEVTAKEASAFLGVKPNTMRNWRSLGKGPAFLRDPIRYRMLDLLRYQESRLKKPLAGAS